MGAGSFIVGLIVGFVAAFAFIIFYIVNTFGWDFLSILMTFADGNISFDDVMGLARYYGYL